MSNRRWKSYRPSSLQDALEASVHHARERHQMSVDRIADAMGIPSKWALYKWIESGSMPARLIRPFESACGCEFITQHVAASARKLLIDLPHGRRASAGDIHAVQEACTSAIAALLAYADSTIDAPTTLNRITDAIEHLARERAEVERSIQPELAL